jgi:phosphohistidine phosphatase
MIVYLLRHGVAEEATRGSDDLRELTPEGITKLERASASWRRVVGRVDRILVSPLVRARQTAEIFARTVAKHAEQVETPELTPGAPPRLAQTLLQAELLHGFDGVACVGHEPNLGALLGVLTTGQERSAIPLKKGMLCAVELQSAASMTGRLLFALGTRQASELG